MQWYFGVLMALIGAYMLFSGIIKANHIPYKWFRLRAEGLWKENADAFLAVSGFIILALGILATLRVIW